MDSIVTRSESAILYLADQCRFKVAIYVFRLFYTLRHDEMKRTVVAVVVVLIQHFPISSTINQGSNTTGRSADRHQSHSANRTIHWSLCGGHSTSYSLSNPVDGTYLLELWSLQPFPSGHAFEMPLPRNPAGHEQIADTLASTESSVQLATISQYLPPTPLPSLHASKSEIGNFNISLALKFVFPCTRYRRSSLRCRALGLWVRCGSGCEPELSDHPLHLATRL